jgi:hypothetical protein
VVQYFTVDLLIAIMRMFKLTTPVPVLQYDDDGSDELSPILRHTDIIGILQISLFLLFKPSFMRFVQTSIASLPNICA